MKNVICRDAETVGKKKTKKTLGALTLEKIRQKHGMASDSMKERVQLKPRVEEVRTKKKRIELIKKSKTGEEGSACGTNLSSR